jgi:flavorubredoxin
MTSLTDHWGVLHELLARVPEPTKEQALEILPALAEIYRRWKAVRSFSPTVKLGDRTLRLMTLVGLHKPSSREA